MVKINSKEKLTEDEIRSLWYFHEAEQLKEKIPSEYISQINEYIKDHPDAGMWKIEQ